jgi:hypothetical protein
VQQIVVVVGVAVLLGAVIVRQLRGEALRGRRLLLLPAILIGVGAVNLSGTPHLKLTPMHTASW